MAEAEMRKTSQTIHVTTVGIKGIMRSHAQNALIGRMESTWNGPRECKREHWYTGICWRDHKYESLWFASSDKGTSDDKSVNSFDSCIEGVEGVGFLEVTGEHRGRPIYNQNHVHLDSCTTDHSMFALEHLNHRHTTGVCLQQNCNASLRLTKRKGFWIML